MELKHADITEKIIGSAVKVHSKMEAGYPEISYARRLAIEFDRIGLGYEKEKSFHVFYEAFIVGGRRVDCMIEEKFVVETKALSAFNHKAFVQAVNHRENHRQEAGLLINFGAKRLPFKRIINKNIPVPVNPVNRITVPDAEYKAGHPLKNPDNPWS